MIADGSATIVRLIHRDLPDEAFEIHRQGWEHYQSARQPSRRPRSRPGSSGLVMSAEPPHGRRHHATDNQSGWSAITADASTQSAEEIGAS